MSVRTRAQTNMSCSETLKKSLTDAGFTFEEAKSGEVLTTDRQYGYGGERVEIRLTGCVGKSTNQNLRAVGFKKANNGTYEAVGDFWHLKDANGRSLRSAQGLKKIVSSRYNYHKAVAAATAKGFQITANKQGVEVNGKIKMVATLVDPLRAGLGGNFRMGGL